INDSPYGEIDMVIKDLDLEPKIDAMMRDFLDPSRWKELSKETSSKILPDHGVSNGGHIGLYIDHYDEDLTDFIKEYNLTDLVMIVDTTSTSNVGNKSSDSSYQLSNYDGEISDSPSLDDEHDDVGNDDDDDENVDFTTLNQTSNDRFLSLFYYDDISSDDVEDEVSSDEN
ncbi:hypothetical protein Tco_0133498, partial [Tanacetum coccineum]